MRECNLISYTTQEEMAIFSCVFLTNRLRPVFMDKMTPQEFEEICSRLGLSRREFGHRFGTGPNQAQRYADGSVKIPGPTAILLRILDRLPELMSMVPEGETGTRRREK